MRLWHKDLIPILPRKQLISQWKECCAIAKAIAIKSSPNHILVNKVLDYPEAQFNVFAWHVYKEIKNRGYECDWNKFTQWRINRNLEWDIKDIFPEWHDDRYFRQCYYNLEEKYDCGGIPLKEWCKIREFVIDKHLIKP